MPLKIPTCNKIFPRERWKILKQSTVYNDIILKSSSVNIFKDAYDRHMKNIQRQPSNEGFYPILKPSSLHHFAAISGPFHILSLRQSIPVHCAIPSPFPAPFHPRSLRHSIPVLFPFHPHLPLHGLYPPLTRLHS